MVQFNIWGEDALNCPSITAQKDICDIDAEVFGDEHWSDATMQSLMERCITICAYEPHKKMVGVLIGRLYIDISNEEGYETRRIGLYIHNIGVRKKWQLKGYGRALLERAVSMCERSGIGLIRLDSLDGSCGFYEKCNMVKDGYGQFIKIIQ